MGLSVRSFLRSFFDVEPHERLKTVLLALTFFLVIGSYTLVKELGGSIFISIVGRSYMPLARVLTMFAFIPAIVAYSRLVDKIRRYQLLVVCSVIFGILGVIFAYYLGHPTIGILNTNASKWRIFGWLFYFFVEGYTPFVVSVFWAFANSVSTPEGAKKSYSIIVSGSKLGGMLACASAWAIFSYHSILGHQFSDVALHQIVLAIAACMLLLVPVVIYLLIHCVSGRYLHGYEAVYQVEKQLNKAGQADTGVWSGVALMFKYPYVLGIFGMIFFYEFVGTVLSFMRFGVAEASAANISDVSGFLFASMFWTHVTGLVISILGTGILLRKFGERICLMLIPLLSGSLLLYLLLFPSPRAMIHAYSGMKAINLAFSWPVRESLYIPTVKEIKFKSKSWIDAVGNKFARASGSLLNMIMSGVQQSFVFSCYSFIFAAIVSLWFSIAYILGRRYENAISNNEVIGYDSSEVVPGQF